MIALDTTFLVDYLDGVQATATYLENQQSIPLFVPALALFEVYRGAGRSAGSDAIERAANALSWLEVLPLTQEAAREAAFLEVELLDSGEPVNLGDTVIAGICRANGASLVSRDAHFDRIPELDVHRY